MQHSFLLAIPVFFLLSFVLSLGFSEESRIPPGDVLNRASKAFENIGDYQAILYQSLKFPDGKTKEEWFKITMVKPIGGDKTVPPTLLIQIYNKPIGLTTPTVEMKEPETVIYADKTEKLFTYKTAAKSVTIEYLQDNSQLPSELLYIAGFLNFDIETLKEKAYLDEQVMVEDIHGSQAYKVRITPRKKMKDIEPARNIWIDKATNMPVQLSVEGDASAVIEFKEYKTNQQIQANTLVPEVPGDVIVNDKTLNTLKPKAVKLPPDGEN